MTERRLKRYKILEELGHGGMATVYRGIDTTLQRDVAIKVLHSHLSKKQESRKRFHREAHAIARLKHRNIIEVYDFSEDDEHDAYIVMEFVQGHNLKEFIEKNGGPPPEISAIIAIDICRALAHAHSHGIIHRDLKPENIMVSNTGELKLTDFGIAHVMDAESVTQTGKLLGSPAYMAPELIEGRRVDARIDVYSVGTLLYWLTTARLPFGGDNPSQIFKNILEGNFTDPEQICPTVGTHLSKIIARCLSHNPDTRYATIREVQQHLQRFVDDSGFAKPGEEFENYFSSPQTYVQAFSKRIVPMLIARAELATSQKRVIPAIHAYNRVLAYDPTNIDVANALKNLTPTHFNPIKYIIAASIFGAILLGLGGYYIVQSSKESHLFPDGSDIENLSLIGFTSAQSSASNIFHLTATHALHTSNAYYGGAVLGAHAAAQASTIVVQQQQHQSKKSPSRSDSSKRKHRSLRNTSGREAPSDITQPSTISENSMPPTQSSGSLTKVRFQVSPPAANLLINGKSYSAMEAAQGVDLPVGEHAIIARSRGCKPLRTSITVDSSIADRVPIILEWEDGHIRIISDEEALVWVDSQDTPQSIGARGHNATLTVPFGRTDSSPNHRQIPVRIASRQDLQVTHSHVVSLRPGGQAIVNVNFTRNKN